MQKFFAYNTFIFTSAENYIEMESVEEKELTLKKARKEKLIRAISMEKPQHWRADLSEVRVDLHDNQINFLGLSPHK